MNSLDELISYGINDSTAKRMLENYKNRIGGINGVYEIVDITYDPNIKGRILTLKCTECGKIVYRTMINGKNKWSELIKTCECCKEKDSNKEELEKILKIKKDLLFESARNLVGTEYGDYKIKAVEDKNEKPVMVLECKICKRTIQAPYRSILLKAEKYKKCKKHISNIKFDDSYIGKKNNMLTVIGIGRLENNHRAFICECDCGNIVMIEPVHWEQGRIKSCGCLYESFKLVHSEELDRLRRIHAGMLQRCYNEKSNAYKYYGGRGIVICDEWKDRDVFIEWAVNNGYSNDLSIDRINVNGNYEPNNCRWATVKEQANNRRPRSKCNPRKRKTKIIDGKEKTLVEWYVEFGVSGPTVAYRMKKMGLSFEEALKMPRSSNGRPRKEVM